MVAEIAVIAVIILMAVAERIHLQRIHRSALLSFGPAGKGASWIVVAPFLRVLGISALTWGLITVFLLPSKIHKIGEIPEAEYRHLLLVLDVSPSMRLEDAGQTGKQSRRARAADLLKSFFERSPIELYKMTVIATYTEAKPVVIDTLDMEIVRNILNELPMEHAFKSGPTDLFSGLIEAAKVAQPWRPKSTLVLVISDGDTVPPNGMPKMPDSVASIVVVGVGDPLAGKFIDGHQSRQDASSLRQVANRLGGTYHNGNEKHLSTELIQNVTKLPDRDIFDRLTKREYALIAIATGAGILALLPLALQLFGTRWRPGVPLKRGSGSAERGTQKAHEVVR